MTVSKDFSLYMILYMRNEIKIFTAFQKSSKTKRKIEDNWHVKNFQTIKNVERVL